VACALGDTDAAARWSAELVALASGPRADYACALADLAGASPTPPGAIEEAACAVEADGRRWEGAWMRIMGADVAAKAGKEEEAGAPGAGALEPLRAMGSEGWCRRTEALLRRLGRRVPSRPSGRGAGGLTKRELEVLGLIADGASNQEIASRLFISKATAIR